MAFAPLPITIETLESLMAEGTEREGLDYKSTCDLGSRRDEVEITKDIGALLLEGGYIVIGANSDGSPSGGLEEPSAQLFDEARLRPKLERYLTAGLEIRCGPLQRGGDWFALICVIPHPEGLAPFRTNGEYDDGRGKPKHVFRAGDIFARHGTSSERWDQRDVTKLLARLRAREREAARAEYQELLIEAQQQASSEQAVAAGPVATLTWDLDIETLAGAIIEQLRASDDIPVTLLLRGTPRTFLERTSGADAPEISAFLDRLITLAAVFLELGRLDLFDRAIGALGAIYDGAADEHGLARNDIPAGGTWIWLEVVGRIYALGALATRSEQWGAVRRLSVQPPRVVDADYWHTWLFHGAVMAARAGLLEDPESRMGKSILVLAQEHVVRLPWLSPDLALDDPEILNSLCQFDLLACAVELGTPGGKEAGSFLPHLYRWHSYRSDPAAVTLIEDSDARATLFPHSDPDLAAALRDIAHAASRGAVMLSGWEGYRDGRIIRFLTDHPAEASDET